MINSIVHDQMRVENANKRPKVFVDEPEPTKPGNGPKLSLFEVSGIKQPKFSPNSEQAQIEALQQENEALKTQIDQNTLSVTKKNWQNVLGLGSFAVNLLVATSDTYMLTALPVTAVGVGIAIQRRHAGWWRPLPLIRLTCLPLMTMVLGAAARVLEEEQKDKVYDPPLRRLLYASGVLASTAAFAHYALRMRLLAAIIGPFATASIGYKYEIVPEIGIFEPILAMVESGFEVKPNQDGIDYATFEKTYMDEQFSSSKWDKSWLNDKDLYPAMKVHIDRAYNRRNDNFLVKSYRFIAGEGRDYVQEALDYKATQQERVGQATMAELSKIESGIERKLK